MNQNPYAKLIAAGHATEEAPTFDAPITTSGNYKATNGFFYFCGWNSGRNHVSKIGFSGEYLNALEEAEALHGVDDEFSDKASQAAYKQLGISH